VVDSRRVCFARGEADCVGGLERAEGIMSRYVVLLRFTEKGVAKSEDSVARAEAFQKVAAQVNARIEGQYWTTGPYDGVLIIDAPDETTAAALVLRLGKDANVSTCMLRAFDAEEFASVLKKIV